MSRNTRQFTDFSLAFNIHPSTADLVKKTDEEAIKASLRNLISTKNYERPFHPVIGCQIFSLLFENVNPITTEVMKKTIYQTIEKFEPRVTVVDVRVKQTPDENSLSVDIIFKIVNTDRPVTFNTVISRVR